MALAYSIGKQKRSEVEVSPNSKFVPGAGSYSPGRKLHQQDAPRWAFGSSKRSGMALRQGTKDVGPG